MMQIFELSWLKLQNQKAVAIQKSWKGFLIRKKFRIVIE